MSSEQAGGTPGPGAVSDRMRALLSRAAEEQLLEQRQVSAVLGELRALLEDVDERLATGEQVERVAAELRGLSARVEARLDAAEARADALAERIGEATAMVGRAAEGLVEAVVAGVAERLEGQLRAATAQVTSSVDARADSGERRLATHVDDAVLALAEVVLRRGRPVHNAQAPAQPVPVEERPAAEPEPEPAGVTAEEGVDEPAGPDTTNGPEAPDEPDVPQPDVPADEAPAADAPTDVPTDEAPAVDVPADVPTDEAPATDGDGDAYPGSGFVLVPADVEDGDAEPAPVVQHERRTADRRGDQRSDGSGRRRRPWWRQV